MFHVGTSSFRFVANHAFDGQTDIDRPTDSFIVTRPRCIQCMQRDNYQLMNP